MNFKSTNHLYDYTPIAGEYYDSEKHPTCHYFSLLSRLYIADQFAACSDNQSVLELGAGDSSAASVMHANNCSLERLVITDASEAMLSYSIPWKDLGATLKVVNAKALPYADNSFDFVIASLADPYNEPAMWSAIARVLRPHGCVVLTLPSYEWAVRFRGPQTSAEFHSAEFVLRDGSVVQVPSFVFPLASQITMIEDAGLMLSSFRSLGSNVLPRDKLSPKVLVFGGPTSSLVWGFTALKVPRVQATRL